MKITKKEVKRIGIFALIIFLSFIASFAQVESRETKTGEKSKIIVIGQFYGEHYDQLNGESYDKYFMSYEKDKRYELDKNNLPNAQAGSQLEIKGSLRDNKLTISSYREAQKRITELTPSRVQDNTLREFHGEIRDNDSSTLGAQRLLIVLVNFQNNNSEPATKEEIYDRVLNAHNPESANSQILEMSYNKAFLVGDVKGWYTLTIDQNNACTNLESMYEKGASLVDPDVDFKKYEKIMFVFPRTNNCNFGGLARFGAKTFATSEGYVTLKVTAINSLDYIGKGVATHELGHNFGLDHAHYYKCPNQYVTSECTDRRYNGGSYDDIYDTMGATLAKGHFNIFHKLKLSWLSPSNLIINPVSGIYKIEKIENPSNELKGIIIQTSSGINYSIEYRRPYGSDLTNYQTYSSFGSDIFDGALIHTNKLLITSSRSDTQVIDPTPEESNNPMLDVFLKKNQTFTDPINKIKITTLDFDDNYLTINLENF